MLTNTLVNMLEVWIGRLRRLDKLLYLHTSIYVCITVTLHVA